MSEQGDTSNGLNIDFEKRYNLEIEKVIRPEKEYRFGSYCGKYIMVDKRLLLCR